MAYIRPSASTNRPSASVFNTSTVLPFLYLMISPNFNARPEIIFSAQHRTNLIRLLSPRAIANAKPPVANAAPPISAFIVAIPAEGLML